MTQRTTPILAAATAAAFLPAATQAQEVLGTITAFLGSEERTWYVTQSDEQGASSWRREDGTVIVTMVGQPSPTMVDEQTGALTIEFAVEGAAGTAEAVAARIAYLPEGGGDLLAGGEEQNVEVSLTAYGLQGDTVVASGNFAGGLVPEGGAIATPEATAIEGDFQATIMPPIEEPEGDLG